MTRLSDEKQKEQSKLNLALNHLQGSMAGAMRRIMSLASGDKSDQIPLVVCAIIRDEAKYVAEWVKFHLAEGVSHIYLYDDDSSDNPGLALKTWIKGGRVTIRKARGRTQEETYQSFLDSCRGRRVWIAFIDIDEFLHPPEAPSLPAKLMEYEGHAAVFVFWKLFGCGKRKETSARGVVEDCMRGLDTPKSRDELIGQMKTWRGLSRGEMMTGRPVQGKSVIRADRVTEMAIHFPIRYERDLVDVSHRVLTPEVLVTEYLEDDYVPPYTGLLINHYWSRSENSLTLKHSKPGAASVTRRDPGFKLASLPLSLKWNLLITQTRDDSLAKRIRFRDFPYIFVIGFNKTATRAIAAFFQENGLPAVHWDQNRLVQQMQENLKQGRKIMSGYDQQYRVFTDIICATDDEIVEGNGFFREMDRDYPNSFFILNNRPTEDWIRSREQHNQGKFLERQLKILGTSDVEDARTLWRRQKLQHEAEVRNYFYGSKRFLEIGIDEPEVPKVLARFLRLNLNQNLWRVIGKTQGPS